MILASLLSFASSNLTPGGQVPARGTVVKKFSSYLRSMIQDSKGRYWFGSDREGISRFDGKQIVRFTTRDGLAGDQIYSMYEDKRGHLLIATSGGVSRFDGKVFRTLHPVIMDNPNRGWRLDPNDLWLAGNFNDGGPLRYDGNKLYRLNFPKNLLLENRQEDNSALSSYAVYTIYKDKRGHIWFGTANAGLCRYDGKSVDWLYEDHLTNTPEGGSFGIRSIIEDRDGKFWFCNTTKRYRIATKNRSSGGLIDYKSELGTGPIKALAGSDPLYFQSVTTGNDGDLWLMPWRSTVFRYDGKKVTPYVLRDGKKEVLMSQVYRERRGDLWVVTQTSGPYKFNGKSFEPFRW